MAQRADNAAAVSVASIAPSLDHLESTGVNRRWDWRRTHIILAVVPAVRQECFLDELSLLLAKTWTAEAQRSCY